MARDNDTGTHASGVLNTNHRSYLETPSGLFKLNPQAWRILNFSF